ncbi:MAG: hypothetical protein ACI9R3_003789, partial [Verrucomicrobiales bacterium]
SGSSNRASHYRPKSVAIGIGLPSNEGARVGISECNITIYKIVSYEYKCFLDELCRLKQITKKVPLRDFSIESLNTLIFNHLDWSFSKISRTAGKNFPLRCNFRGFFAKELVEETIPIPWW